MMTKRWVRHFSHTVQSAVVIGLVLLTTGSYSETINQTPESIATTALHNFDANPDKVKQLLRLGLALTNDKLHYQYGSANPKLGGMDCSGTIYYMLTTLGITDVPRSSHLQYQWIWEKGHFYAVNGNTMNSFEFSHLRPGDLLFWSNTYTAQHDPNVTHVMIYLGKNQAGQALMMGASNGRTYQGRKIDGVSVFDFKFPDTDSRGHFLGYGCIPKVSCTP